MTFGTLLALCSRSPLCGHSLRARIQGSVELTDRGQTGCSKPNQQGPLRVGLQTPKTQNSWGL